MNNEITMERNGRTVKYRLVKLAHNWARSTFEYFNESQKEWREVQNWNSKEILFDYYSKISLD